MRKPFAHRVGGVLSADIAVPDHKKEVAFYSQILTTGIDPLWREDLTNNTGTPIIGLGVRLPEYEALPLQWMPHFQVADIATSVARTLELGGKELMHGKDDDGQSQWAVLTDQGGAAFGLIPVVPSESAIDKIQRAGCITWLSLIASDTVASQDFYKVVVGWSAKPVVVEDGEGQHTGYEMQMSNGDSAAEICHASADYAGIPHVWLLSLPVDDFEESLRRVRSNGGEILKEMSEAKYAIVQDPVGVCIALQAWQ
ncbi:MAG: hypothetical protein DWQ05_04085 [Calditrichaeota bacterium]|nr:MAG: hypothetical protein DWQ05_04085 [Calditrichota bacterium]